MQYRQVVTIASLTWNPEHRGQGDEKAERFTPWGIRVVVAVCDRAVLDEVEHEDELKRRTIRTTMFIAFLLTIFFTKSCISITF